MSSREVQDVPGDNAVPEIGLSSKSREEGEDLDTSGVWIDVDSDTSSKMNDEIMEENDGYEDDIEDDNSTEKSSAEDFMGNKEHAENGPLSLSSPGRVARFNDKVIKHNRRRMNKIFSFVQIIIFLFILLVLNHLSGNQLYFALLPWYSSLFSSTASKSSNPLQVKVPVDLMQNVHQQLDVVTMVESPLFQGVDSPSLPTKNSPPTDAKETAGESEKILQQGKEPEVKVSPVDSTQDFTANLSNEADEKAVNFIQNSVTDDSVVQSEVAIELSAIEPTSAASENYKIQEVNESHSSSIFSKEQIAALVTLLLFCGLLLMVLRNRRGNISPPILHHDNNDNNPYPNNSYEQNAEYNTPVKLRKVWEEDDRIITRSASKRKSF